MGDAEDILGVLCGVVIAMGEVGGPVEGGAARDGLSLELQ